MTDDTGRPDNERVDAEEDADPTAPTVTDRLAALVRSPQDTGSIKLLWRETFALDRWWFVPVGQPGQWSPAAAPIEGTNMLLAFTTAPRARQFAVDQELVGEGAPFEALAIPPADVVANASDYVMAGIAAVIVDPQTSGHFAPMERLAPMWAELHGEAPPDA